VRSTAEAAGDRRPGSYAVVLEPTDRGPVRIGRLGSLRLELGCYVYVGSALGPGGVAARCRHHMRISARPHWHLDYLRPRCRIVRIWTAYGLQRREHEWAAALGALPASRRPLPGFGASDCRCPAHLIQLSELPDEDLFCRVLGKGEWLTTPGD